MSLLVDAFTYFAKFPEHNSVLKNFNKSDSTIVSGYADLLNTITNLTEKSLIPEITDYVFGIDESSVKSKIRDISGIYQFLDYGNLYTEKDDIQREYTEQLLALNIARPVNPDKTDLVEEIILADTMLAIVQQIRDKMKSDQIDNPFMKELEFPHQITPFFSSELSNSVGWTLIFKRRGVGIL